MMRRKTIATAIGVIAVIASLVAMRIGNPICAWRSYRCAEAFVAHVRSKEYSSAAQMFDPRTATRFSDAPNEFFAHEWPAVRDYRIADYRRRGEFAVVTFRIHAEHVDRMAVTVLRIGDKHFVTMTNPPGI